MNASYYLSWKEWRIEERLDLLKEAYIQYEITNKDDYDNISITHLFDLSSGQEEVWNFVIDPTYPVKFYKLDTNLGKKMLEIFVDFWSWRFK